MHGARSQHLHMSNADQQARYGEAVELKASAQPGQQVHEGISVVDWRALLIIKSSEDPCLLHITL